MVLGTDKYSIIGLGEWGLLLDRSHDALVFFLLFLALAAILFNREEQFEHFW